ncbi:MAG TPA: hypothetical protein VKR21_08200 [Solirubrobacteraceae bacterium]|nr:hypothetical protein [Solirubrobacteraceae bacterium]
MKIRERAPGKLNLCLFLGPVRQDGRHELVTLFESVSLADELVISLASSDEVIAPGVEGPNLVSQALAGLRRHGWRAPPLRIEIDKRIPIAGGMGGGSADAAALLRVAPRFAPVGTVEVEELAVELGADVPAQLIPGLAVGTGAGEDFSLRAALADHAFTILPAATALSTAAVYAEADRLGLGRDRDELRARLAELEASLEPGERLPNALLINDLEPATRSLCPQIDDALLALRNAGADRVLVCGSGPTVAGLYWGADAEGRAQAAAASLVARFPGATAARPVASPS